MSVVDHVLVAGGGIGGLCLGIGLRRAGVRVTIVERSAIARRRGSGIVLAPNGMKALRSLGRSLAEDVRATGCESGGARQGHKTGFFTEAGASLATFSFDGFEKKWEAPAVSILRQRFVEVLRNHALACGVEIVEGVKVTGYREETSGIVLLLQDQEPLHGSLLVGADGLRSTIRSQLLGDGPPTYRGYTAVRGVGPCPKEHPDGFIAYGRGTILFVSSVGQGRAYWVASMLSPPGTWPQKEPAEAHRLLLESMRDWHPHFLEVIEHAEPEACILTDVYDRDPVDTWYKGKVVLLGDAAHPMVYTMGQGANTAIEDALVLASQLQQAPSLQRALVDYQSQRLERTSRILRQSRMMGSMGHARSALFVWFRNTMMSLMSKFADVDKENAPVFGWEPPALGLGEEVNP